MNDSPRDIKKMNNIEKKKEPDETDGIIRVWINFLKTDLLDFEEGFWPEFKGAIEVRSEKNCGSEQRREEKSSSPRWKY